MKFLAHRLPYVCIIFVWFLFSSPYFLKNLVPFPSTYLVSFFPPWNAYYGMPIKNNAMPDIITQIFPWKKLTIDTWKMGQLPLWNPYSFSGTVHGGNYQSAIFSPVNLLFSVFPFVHAWSMSVLLQPLFAGFFMCYFLKMLNRSNAAAVMGSISFMFCGFMTGWMGYATLGWAITFLPLILSGIVKYRESKSWWFGILISLGVSLSFLSGHYQISLYVLLASGMFIFGTSTSWRERGILTFFLFLGVLLCMAQILLSLHSLLQSNRSSSFTSGAIPWQYLMTLFSPDFYGNPVTRNDWFGQYAEWASFIGVIPLSFAFYAICGKRSSAKNIFLGILILSLLLVMSTPFNQLLYNLQIPIVSTSVATRMIVLFSFSLIVLSAFGVDELKKDWMDRTVKRITYVSICIIIFLVGLWGFLLLIPSIPQEYLVIAKRNSILPSAVSILCVSLWLLGTKIKQARGVFIAGLILITGFEMLRFSTKWMPFESMEFVYPNLPVILQLQKSIGNNRVFGTFGNELDTYYGLPSVEGYDALYQQRYGEFISAAGDGTIQDLQRSVVQLDKQGMFTNRWLELLGARYLLYRQSDGRNVWVFPHWKYPQYVSIYKDDKYELLENTSAFSRAFLVSSYQVIQDKEAILASLASEQTNLQTTVILEEKLPEELKSGNGTVTIQRYTPNTVELDVYTEGTKLLFLSDAYDPGWKVKVNGKPKKLYRADYAFRAVTVPDGNSSVVFYYQPKLFIIGMWISGFSIFFIIAGSMRKLLYGYRHL